MKHQWIWRFPRIARFSLWAYHKIKHRQLVRFWYSTHLSHDSQFEGMNYVGRNTDFCGSLGLGTSVGDGSLVNADIGRFTSIGSHLTYTNGYHPYKEPFVTTSSLFYSLARFKTPHGRIFARRQMLDEFKYYDKERGRVNKIGSDCWIGIDVNLIGGVEIGDGAVVLSRAVVTHNVPPYAIVGGIPARIIGYRYDEETIKMLLRVKWWNNTTEWFDQHWQLLNDMTAFKQYFNAEE